MIFHWINYPEVALSPHCCLKPLRVLQAILELVEMESIRETVLLHFLYMEINENLVKMQHEFAKNQSG